VDDSLATTLTPEQLGRVMRPKVDAARHLDELTAGTSLSALVLFSSAAAMIGSPGQANYGAANAVLDALAHRRKAAGLAATSLAWGLWSEAGGMSADLASTARARLEQLGLGTIDTELGLELFDRALGLDNAVLASLRLDPAALRRSQPAVAEKSDRFSGGPVMAGVVSPFALHMTDRQRQTVMAQWLVSKRAPLASSLPFTKLH
jgi:hypothetical protein